MSDNEFFRNGETMVGGDNIRKSKERYEAIQRVRHGQGTSSDYELVHATDRMIAEVMKQRKR